MVDLPLPGEAPVLASPAEGSGEEALRCIVERVRDWQHRHPLARRISAREVVGVGIVALPYAPSAAPGARPGEIHPLFQQPRLLPGLSHQALLDFAARHGVEQPPGPADWARREVARADGSSEPAPQTRYLLTAAVSDARPHGISPRRLLLAPAGKEIWGHRELSRPRVALAAGAALLLAGAVLAAAFMQGRAATQPRAAAEARGPEAVPKPASALVPAAPPSALSATGEADASASGAAGVPQAPASVPLVPRRLAGEASSPASRPMPDRDMPPVPAEPHYALISAPAKKQESAEATLQQVRRLLGPALGPMQAQVMPSPQGYVVTIWPLPTQADAERLAEVLARRGVPMKWMEF
ncbi:hypothetical protein [Ideonella sp. YS5]|uniref:hypothetical protein n=1 Tax=Ideonella sp. YS5 TaxID=3453714 RepID=UPI003EE874FB